MRVVLLLSLAATACKTRLHSVGETDLRDARRDLAEPIEILLLPDRPDLATRDLAVIDLGPPPDLAIPPDLEAPPDLEDLLPPPDLTRPHHCDGIFVFDEDGWLSFFDPQQLTFSDVAPLVCPSAGSPFSMALARDGTAWIEYTGGELFLVDSYTGACRPSGFVPNQQGFHYFGMGFAADGPGSTSETLYIANLYGFGPTSPRELGRIDTQTLQVTPIGPLSDNAEMTGLGDGELWGFFGSTAAHAARLDKTSGAILEDVPLPQVGNVSDAAFAFGNFGGNFWIFVAPFPLTTKVYRLHRPDNSVTLEIPYSGRHIVGAGVSTCAPGMSG